MGKHLYPNESIYAVIEICSYGREADLKKAIQKLIKLKQQSREAFYTLKGDIRYLYHLYGKKRDFPPILTVLFSFVSSPSKIAEIIKSVAAEEQVSHLEVIDLVICFGENKGYLTWEGKEGKIEFTPSETSKIAVIKADASECLAFLYQWISTLLGQIHLPSPRILSYFKQFK